MTRKEWITVGISRLGLFIPGGGVYLANIREIDDLRVVVDRTPKLSIDDSLKSLVAEFDEYMTFMNEGTRSATIMKSTLLISQPDDTGVCINEMESSWTSSTPPFEIKSHELRAVAIKGETHATILPDRIGRPVDVGTCVIFLSCSS